MRLRGLVALLIVAYLTSAVASATVGDLRPFVRGSWKEIRTAHAGRPTVVHFWGLTCGPCRVEMPQWGALLRERGDMNLVLINADFVPDHPQAVTAWLDRTQLLAAENWMFDDGFAERLRREIDPAWQGEIPRTMLIAGDGTVTAVSGVMPMDDVRGWLDKQRAK